MKKFLRIVHLYLVFSGDVFHEDGTLAWREEHFSKIAKASTWHGSYRAKRSDVKAILDFESWDAVRSIFWFERTEEIPETCPDPEEDKGFGFDQFAEMFTDEEKSFEDFEAEKYGIDKAYFGFDRL